MLAGVADITRMPVERHVQLHDTRSAVLSCMRCYVGTRGTTARPFLHDLPS
jgi:hypothetical protein